VINYHKIKKIADSYRKGIAKALGVPPEDINPEVVEKYVEDLYRAFLKPGIFRQDYEEIESAAKGMTNMIKNKLKKNPELFRS